MLRIQTACAGLAGLLAFATLLPAPAAAQVCVDVNGDGISAPAPVDVCAIANTNSTACNGNQPAGRVVKAVGNFIFYVEERDDGSVWVYQESNGEPGLQRGGSSILLGSADPDACQESDNPDTLIF